MMVLIFLVNDKYPIFKLALHSVQQIRPEANFRSSNKTRKDCLLACSLIES